MPSNMENVRLTLGLSWNKWDVISESKLNFINPKIAFQSDSDSLEESNKCKSRQFVWKFPQHFPAT